MSALNLIKNPSVEVDANGWTATNGTAVRVTDKGAFGTCSMRLKSTSGSTTANLIYNANNSVGIDVTPGKTYSMSFSGACDATFNQGVGMYFDWYNSSNVLISSTSISPGTFTNSAGWRRTATYSGAAPAGAAYVTLRWNVLFATTLSFWVDGVVFSEAYHTAYFDGSTANGAWTGTAHASTSTYTESGLADPTLNTLYWAEFDSGLPEGFTVTGAAGFGIHNSPGAITTIDGRTGTPYSYMYIGANVSNENSYVEKTVTVGAGGGTVEFWARRDSESGYDYNKFFIDGVEKYNVSGVTNTWTKLTYAVGAGTHTLKWQSTSDSGVNVTNHRIAALTVTGIYVPPAPAADFTFTNNYLEVDFSDISTESPTSWAWTFGDGGTSTAQNPTHTYTSAGTYSVTLTATNANGSDGETKSVTVTAPPSPPIKPGIHSRLEVDIAGVWTDITGPTKNINIGRHDSDVGLMSAEVLDANLDPTQASTLRPGRKVRVSAKNGAAWSVIYTGTIDSVDVDYEPLARDGKKVNVRFNASDNVSYLSNQVEPRGVGTINELRWLITGVPFNINGNTTGLGSGTVVSGNDNATLWDNVLITRDSNLGYAWVGKDNRLNVFDSANMDTTIKAVINPDVYNSLDVDFTLDQIINSVTVNWMRYNIGTETSSSVAYGPYQDSASIAEWGVRAATFTVQGATEVEADIAAFANDVLARNATAEVRPRSAAVSIRDTGDLTYVNDLDLNSYVTVVYTDGVTTKTMRVVGITHTITADKWTVDFEFALPSGVTAPSVTPDTPTSTIPDGSIGEPQLDPTVVTDIQTAQQQAQQALTDAEEAFNYADTKNKTYYQTTKPTGGTYKNGDIWFDTDDGNRQYVYVTNDFIDARDTGIASALSQASAAASAASTAQSTANTAQTTANGKNKVHYNTGTPGTTANTAGDIWFQKDASNIIIGQWEGTGGTSWIAKTIGTQVIANLDVGKLTSGSIATPTITLGTATTTGVIESYNYAAASTGFNLTKNGLTAKGGTITGALIQTDSGANTGFKLMNTGMTAKDSGGNLKLSFTTSTGELIINGPVVSSGSITGASITASSTGVIQTESTPARGIKMNSAGFTAYDSVGSPTFTITASSGAVAMKGTLTSGSTITGASISGSTFNTSTTDSGARTKLVSQGIEFWDANNIKKLWIYNDQGSVRMTMPGFTYMYIDGGIHVRDSIYSDNGGIYAQTGSIYGGLTVDGNVMTNNIRPNTGNIVSFGANTYVNMQGTVKSGTRSCPVNALNTDYNQSVTFSTAFPAEAPIPTVVVSANVSNSHHVTTSVTGISRTGFTIQYRRSLGATGAIDINWIATAS